MVSVEGALSASRALLVVLFKDDVVVVVEEVVVVHGEEAENCRVQEEIGWRSIEVAMAAVSGTNVSRATHLGLRDPDAVGLQALIRDANINRTIQNKSNVGGRFGILFGVFCLLA